MSCLTILMVTNQFTLLFLQSEVYLISYIPTLVILNERVIDYVGTSSDVNDLVDILPHQLLLSDKIYQRHTFISFKEQDKLSHRKNI